MKLPQSCEIGSHRIRVRLAPAREMEDDGSYGHFSPLKLEIAIREDLAPSLQWSTLIHEMIEAISGLYQLELAESQIDVLAEGLSQALTLTKGKDQG